MSKPVLLDLFCGAGGCTRGYQQAGFYVVGVDIKPQPHYVGDEFYQADALEFCARRGKEFDAIHASPPCQAYSRTQAIWGRQYPALVPQTVAALQQSGLAWVIENVPGCSLPAQVVLCGTAFGLKVYRHRLFACSHLIMGAPHCRGHKQRAVATGRQAKDGDVMTVAGHFSSIDVARRAMGIDWMTRDELAQAIPPAYTEFVGRQLIKHVGNSS